MLHAQNNVALLANIGGTHARFGLALPPRAGQPCLAEVRQYSAADFGTLTEAAAHYLGALSGAAVPTRGVFAVASAVTGDLIKITNNPWSFSIRAVGQELGLSELRVINDFCALSQTLSLLDAGDVHVIGPVPPRTMAADGNATYAVVGPGTGLGVGCVALRQGRQTVIESEGGHVSFAPNDPYEMQVLDQLLRQFGRASAERLISGSGLVNLYRAVCAIEGVPAEVEQPAEITARASMNAGDPCARTLIQFCNLLGSFAGDVALSFGAWDGVFLAGGIVQKILPWLAASDFRGRFEAKGRHQPLMQRIPTQVVLHPHAELLGAASLDAGR
jgi:glucokinase